MEQLGFSDAEVLVGTQMRFNAYEICNVGDVVIVKEGSNVIAGRVWLHSCISRVDVSVIDCWKPQSINRDLRSAEWLTSNEPQLAATDDILATVIKMPVTDRIVRTLLPNKLMMI